jgi:hypothetical protein
MARLVIIEVKTIDTNNLYSFNPSHLIPLGSLQINLNSKSFKKSTIRQIVKDIGEDIITMKNAVKA